MRSSTGPHQFSPSHFLVLSGIVIFALLASPVGAQLPPQPGAPAGDISNIPKSVTDTFDRFETRNLPNLRQAQENAEKDEMCLLSPLTLVTNPTIAAAQLRIPGKAKKEYHESCMALRHKKIAEAEKHAQSSAGIREVFCSLGDTRPGPGR